MGTWAGNCALSILLACQYLNVAIQNQEWLKKLYEWQYTFTVSTLSREVVKPVIALARERTRRVWASGQLVAVVLVAGAFVKIYRNRSSLFDTTGNFVSHSWGYISLRRLEIVFEIFFTRKQFTFIYILITFMVATWLSNNWTFPSHFIFDTLESWNITMVT